MIMRRQNNEEGPAVKSIIYFFLDRTNNFRLNTGYEK